MVIKTEIFTHHMLVGVVFPLMVLRMTVVSLCTDGHVVSVSNTAEGCRFSMLTYSYWVASAADQRWAIRIRGCSRCIASHMLHDSDL